VTGTLCTLVRQQYLEHSSTKCYHRPLLVERVTIFVPSQHFFATTRRSHDTVGVAPSEFPEMHARIRTIAHRRPAYRCASALSTIRLLARDRPGPSMARQEQTVACIQHCATSCRATQNYCQRCHARTRQCVAGRIVRRSIGGCRQAVLETPFEEVPVISV